MENDIINWCKKHKSFLKKSYDINEELLNWMSNCFVLYFNDNKMISELDLQNNNYWYTENLNSLLFCKNEFIMKNIIMVKNLNNMAILKQFLLVFYKYCNKDLKLVDV